MQGPGASRTYPEYAGGREAADGGAAATLAVATGRAPMQSFYSMCYPAPALTSAASVSTQGAATPQGSAANTAMATCFSTQTVASAWLDAPPGLPSPLGLAATVSTGRCRDIEPAGGVRGGHDSGDMCRAHQGEHVPEGDPTGDARLGHGRDRLDSQLAF